MSSVINSVLLAVIGLAQATDPYAQIVVGALPPDNGISCTIATGGADATFLDKGMAYSVELALNGKHTDQEIVSDALNIIHETLAQATSYPRASRWQITNISTIAAPSLLSREENGQILYGSALEVNFFFFKGEH